MKTKILTAIALIALMACMISTATAAVPPYDVYKVSPADPVHLGDTVTLAATTSNSHVNTVVFKWYAPGDYPSGSAAFTSTDGSSADGFTSTNPDPIDKPGRWIVVATFEKMTSMGLKPIEDDPVIYQVDVNGDFFVLPEYPLIGSAGVFVAMGLGLLFFKRKAIGNQLF
jgi:hypothetical protein